MKCDIKSLARRALSLALCAVMALALVPAAQAASVTPTASTNAGAQEYVNGRRWASTVKSYLYPNSIGGLTRVEYTGGKILVEDYDSQFRAQASRSIPLELSIWGGFFAGENYNFLVFGQNNEEENDSKEVVRIVKYSKDWQRLGQTSLYGANTIHPFAAGSVRFAEHNGYLYVHTCHEMYASSDGRNHQASVMILIRESDMKITDSAYEVGGVAYTSHSFNQYVKFKDGSLYVFDHGDAYPRALQLVSVDNYGKKNRKEKTSSLFKFMGEAGENYTGCEVGGMEIGTKSVLVCGKAKPHKYKIKGVKGYGSQLADNIFLTVTNRKTGKTTVKWLTNDNPKSSRTQLSVPKLVKLADDRFAVLYTTWKNGKEKLQYVVVDDTGKKVYSKSYSNTPFDGESQPILNNGYITWFAEEIKTAWSPQGWKTTANRKICRIPATY